LPGDDHAVDRAAEFELLSLELIEPGLVVEALELAFEVLAAALDPQPLVGRDLLLEQRLPGRQQVFLRRGPATLGVGHRDLQVAVAERGQQLPGLHRRAVLHARLDAVHAALALREHVAAMHRLERALALQPQLGRHEDQGGHGGQAAQG
ncbi:MAG: hypothetical protein ACK55I_15885, partial [bacterium]